MYYIAANIGRNIGDTPMSESAWQSFQHDVATTLFQAGARLEDAHGIIEGVGGEWQGTPEESAHVWQLLTEAPSASTIADTKHTLKILARDYGQDAIALIVGESALV